MQSAAYQPDAATERRAFTRHMVRAHARLRIGNRQYAAFLVNISRGGAKISTVTPIQDHGDVSLRLPDLLPIRGKLRWNSATEGGVIFCLPLLPDQLADWVDSRRATRVCR